MVTRQLFRLRRQLGCGTTTLTLAQRVFGLGRRDAQQNAGGVLAMEAATFPRFR